MKYLDGFLMAIVMMGIIMSFVNMMVVTVVGKMLTHITVLYVFVMIQDFILLPPLQLHMHLEYVKYLHGMVMAYVMMRIIMSHVAMMVVIVAWKIWSLLTAVNAFVMNQYHLHLVLQLLVRSICFHEIHCLMIINIYVYIPM